MSVSAMKKSLAFSLLSMSLFSFDAVSFETRAIPVYNLAYQENYRMDNIWHALNRARGAYVLMDPFGSDNAKYVSAIKKRNNEVGAYISIGTGETYRSDFSKLRPHLVNTAWSSWSDEYFVDKVTPGLLKIMKARIDKIADWGFDWVEFDNMDWFYDDYQRSIHNFRVTIDEGKDYYQELCDYVHSKGMNCMAKNVVESASDFDGVTYESSKYNKNWWQQAGTEEFLAANKLVIINHYNERNCSKAYRDYRNIYNNDLSFICENAKIKRYTHFNQ